MNVEGDRQRQQTQHSSISLSGSVAMVLMTKETQVIEDSQGFKSPGRHQAFDVCQTWRYDSWLGPQNKVSVSSSYSRGDKTHVDAPEQTDEAEKDDAAVDGDEGEADDGGDGPNLVTGHNDRDGFLSQV
jgi:hypothetical protein